MKPNFETQVAAIWARLRQSRIVCSDETGARVKDQNAWEWVFQNDDLSVHVIRNSRAEAVMGKVMARQPTNKHGKRLRKRYRKDRDSLFTFMTEPGVPPTNIGSERDIRPSTVFRIRGASGA